LLLVTLVSLGSAPNNVLTYDFEWSSFSSLTRWTARSDGVFDEVVIRGERFGRGIFRLTPDRRAGMWLAFSFAGEGGTGQGTISRLPGPNVDPNISFPIAVPVGQPAANRQLTAGVFQPNGDPDRPDSFELSYSEGFICHSTPAVCSYVKTWERSLRGHGTQRRAGL
jgi:hypothetical protein